jgi:hypothetical protein
MLATPWTLARQGTQAKAETKAAPGTQKDSRGCQQKQEQGIATVRTSETNVTPSGGKSRDASRNRGWQHSEKIINKSYRYTIKKQQQGCQHDQGVATVRKS